MKLGDKYTTKKGELGIINDIMNLGHKTIIEIKLLGITKLVTIKNGIEQ